MRELKDVSLRRSAQSVGIPADEMERTLGRLKKDQVIVKFQPVFDHQKLGVRWFHISVNALTFDPRFTSFVDFLHELTNVVHINLSLGRWDINYEVHCVSREELDSIMHQIHEEFGCIINEHRVIEIGLEHKFNFLVDAVLDAARER